MKKFVFLGILIFILLGGVAVLAINMVDQKAKEMLSNPSTITEKDGSNDNETAEIATPASGEVDPEKEAVTAQPSPNQSEKKFSKIGNLTNFDSKTEKETDNWSLVYEKPGQPALKAGLRFTAASICNLNGKEALCDPAFFENGERVQVEGNSGDDSVVSVTKLIKIFGAP